MAKESFKNRGTIPDKPPKQTTHVVRPVKYLGNISAFLGLLGLFAGLLGSLGVLSRLFGLGINMPGALPVSILGLVFSFLGVFFAGKQAEIARTLASTAGVVLGSLGLIASVLAVASVMAAPSASPDIPGPGPNPEPGPFGDGYCQSTPECDGFGSRHCSGEAVCSNDNLCHCIFVSCKGNNCAPLSCSAGCDANSRCDAQTGMCIFNRGGLTSD
jgi:hypothetical protein